ncbi:MAG: hypothetical protein R2800_02640 [Flavipsychrobacter sp.]
MKTITKEYEDFAYTATQLSAYARTMDVFVIALRTGEIIEHRPENAFAFQVWLNFHHIRNIEQEWLPQ